MIIEFDNFLNENLKGKELIEDLKGAKHINVNFIDAQVGWGISYYKNGKRYDGGSFHSNPEAHEFLIDNNIDYTGKEGYLDMKRRRTKMNLGIPYPLYQQELMIKGIDDML